VDDEKQKQLLTGPVGPTLLRMAFPMMVGIAAVIFFNIVDTFWVGQLGGDELAAMAFTFPVVMVVSNLTIGLSIGATAAIARAIGEGHKDKVRRLTTHALILALLVVIAVCALGLVTFEPLFRALGASEDILVLIGDYMIPWYWGVGLLVVPMLGNGAIRATGDMKTPAIVMMCAGFVNAGLDPILIFGWGPVPKLGLTGAAIATIASYGIAMAVMSYILIRREKMITFEVPSWKQLRASWGAILLVGIPAAGTNLLTPLAAGALTRIVSSHGDTAVAAYGVGTRIESLSMIGVFAMTAAITTFVGQNHGAKNGQRVMDTFYFVTKGSAIWGGGIAILLYFLSGPIARVFNEDPVIIEQTMLYLRIVPLSYIAFGIAMLVASMFNALNMPLKATGLAALRLVVLAVPLAWVGSSLFGLVGLFGGIVAANVVMGLVAFVYARSTIGKVRDELAA
jgi:putative MATE family efflux protein